MRHHSWWLSTALLAGSFLVACQPQASTEVEPAQGSPNRVPDRYEIIDLGTLEGDALSFPTGINNNGQIVGVSVPADETAVRGFVWDAENGMTEISRPAEYEAMQTGLINDRGQVVGTLFSVNQPPRAFVWEQGELSMLDPQGEGTYTEAYSINDNGDVVGATDDTPDGRVHGFLMRQGQMTVLGALEGGTYSVAASINGLGNIVGFGDNAAGLEVGLLWLNAGQQMIDLSTTLSISDFIPLAISDDNDLLGHSDSLNHAILVEPGGDITNLGSLSGVAGASEAFDLNRDQQVVGLSTTPEGVEHAFVWDDGVMVDLNTLIPAEAQVELRAAMGINEFGEIAAFGTVGGVQHAFLLRPSMAQPQ